MPVESHRAIAAVTRRLRSAGDSAIAPTATGSAGFITFGAILGATTAVETSSTTAAVGLAAGAKIKGVGAVGKGGTAADALYAETVTGASVYAVTTVAAEPPLRLLEFFRNV